MLGDFHTADINFGGGGDDKFLVCSTQRDSIKGQRSSHKQQATAQLLQQKHPLAPVVPSEDDQNGPGSDAGPQFSHVLTEGFLAMAQQLSRHVFSRIVSRHFAKLNHSDTSILVATSWFSDSSHNFLLLFLFTPGFSCGVFPLVHGFSGIHS